MTNTIITRKGIDNYGIIDGFIAKKGVQRAKITTKSGETIDKVSFTLITNDFSKKLSDLLHISTNSFLTFGEMKDKNKLMCVHVEALSYTAKFCKSLKPNSRVQLLGEFKIHDYNEKQFVTFLLSTKPSVLG